MFGAQGEIAAGAESTEFAEVMDEMGLIGIAARKGEIDPIHGILVLGRLDSFRNRWTRQKSLGVMPTSFRKRSMKRRWLRLTFSATTALNTEELMAGMADSALTES